MYLLCFRYLFSKSLFRSALHRTNNFANYAKPLAVTATKSFILNAEIGRVNELEAGIQEVPFVQIFWNFHNIVMKHK